MPDGKIVQVSQAIPLEVHCHKTENIYRQIGLVASNRVCYKLKQTRVCGCNNEISLVLFPFTVVKFQSSWFVAQTFITDGLLSRKSELEKKLQNVGPKRLCICSACIGLLRVSLLWLFQPVFQGREQLHHPSQIQATCSDQGGAVV